MVPSSVLPSSRSSAPEARDPSPRPVLVLNREPIKPISPILPVGYEPVHQRDKAVIVSGLQQVSQLVNKQRIRGTPLASWPAPWLRRIVHAL